MFDRWVHESLGADRLPGEPTRDEQRARYAELVGRDVGDTYFHEVFAATRYTAIVVRVELNNIEADGLADDSKILFIGNSLTYVNDLPAMLTAVAAQAGKTLTTAQVTEGGFALEDHFREGRAQAEIAKGYQLVILQQGPSALKSSPSNVCVGSADW